MKEMSHKVILLFFPPTKSIQNIFIVSNRLIRPTLTWDRLCKSQESRFIGNWTISPDPYLQLMRLNVAFDGLIISFFFIASTEKYNETSLRVKLNLCHVKCQQKNVIFYEIKYFESSIQVSRFDDADSTFHFDFSSLQPNWWNL